VKTHWCCPHSWRDGRGNGAVMGVLATALLILLTGAVYDAYSAYHYRTWGYQVAGEAARRAAQASVLADRADFYASGQIGLDATAARDAAESFLSDAFQQKGIAAYSYDVRVITAPGGGTVAGFPSVRQASLDGRDMHLGGPGVGVYLEFSIPTAWLGLASRHEYRIHVFSSAEAVEIAN
jgi:Flp pilus assembly protein TadG